MEQRYETIKITSVICDTICDITSSFVNDSLNPKMAFQK